MYRRKDAYYRRAKNEGLRSRAAYKLLELNRSHRLIRPRNRVVDLGAWPGGWLQVAADAVGSQGRVVGVDRHSIAPLPQPWVRTVLGDAEDENVQSVIAAALGGLADVIISDLAPSLTGVRARDEVEASRLVEVAVRVAVRLLRPDGRMLVKLFMNSETPEVLAGLRRYFAKARTTRLKSTREGSSELYAVAEGFRPEEEPSAGNPA